MKTYVFTFIVALTIAGCAKTGKPGIKRDSLTGNWQLIEQYVSIGGPGQWQPADPQHMSFVGFGDNEIVFTTDGRSKKYHLQVIDSSTLKITNATGEYRYGYAIENNELILSPPCIEGCMQKYAPVIRID